MSNWGKDMKKRFLAGILVCLLLTGCGPRRTEVLAQEPAAEGPTIAYVPLDDRPDNVERVVYLAQSLGYQLAMPEPVSYHTALDGQPKNYGSLQCGDPWSLYTWVLEQETKGCDRYILSMDQLLSGGLVSSRSISEDEVPIPGGGTTSSSGLLAHLLEALAEDGDNVVWLLDSVMRLAPTVGYEGGTLEEYEALRSYGIEPRPELSGEALTLESVTADYRLDGSGAPLEPADFGLTEARVELYLAARERKLRLTEQMLEMVAGEGYEAFRVLIGIDDSSAETCIQKNEIALLRRGLRDGDALLSGVDDLAFKAVAKLYLEESGWQGASAAVTYFGGTEDRPACAYDFQPLTEILEEHLAFFGLEAEEAAAADLQVLVLTQPEDPGQAERYCRELVEVLKSGEDGGVPTILIDAGNGAYGTMFHEMLTEKVQLGRLISYAGFLDMAIVTGTALSHGVARYAFLQNGTDTAVTERAFLRTVADSILKDFCYKHIVREDLLGYIRNDLGGDPNNFWLPDIDRGAILERLEQGMAEATKPVIRNLERSNFLTGPGPEHTEKGWGGIALEDYRFPWDRAFEIGMDIRLGESTAPHQRYFGFYIR